MLKCTAIGNLGKDATINEVNGKKVINFPLAHTEKWKDSTGTAKEKTVWLDCAYWTDRDGVMPYLKKGAQVYVEGVPDIRTYQTNDGKTGASLTVRILGLQLLGSKPAGATTTNDSNAAGGGSGDAGGELPF